MLERHELDIFLTLAEELHFGRTATRLRISTARVSQTIRKLERRVGVPLFNRTSRRVELTEVGRRLRADVAPAWASITVAVEAAVAAGKGVTGTLRIGFVSALAGEFLARATRGFRDRHRDCEVRLREAQIFQLTPWLLDGEVDVAMGTIPLGGPTLTHGPVLVREPRMLAVPRNHRLANRESVTLEDLASVRLLRMPDTLDERVRADRSPARTPSGRPIEAGPVAQTMNELLTLIGAGEGGLTVGEQTTRYYARPDVSYVPFRDAPPLEWGLLWRVDAVTARVRAFARVAEAIAAGDRSRPV